MSGDVYYQKVKKEKRADISANLFHKFKVEVEHINGFEGYNDISSEIIKTFCKYNYMIIYTCIKRRTYK